jgi:sorbitol-specific phosphotransferase system component IIC
VLQFLTAVIPSLGVLLIFWVAIRALVQADRRERSAQARIEAAERRQNSPGTPGTGP